MYKKRDKRSRLRGRGTCGYGSKKKHRNKGSTGGKGNAGLGGPKRASMLKYFPDWFGNRKGFVSIHEKNRLKVINLDEINRRLEEFKKRGLAKTTDKGLELNLKGWKILGAGKLNHKLIIKAGKVSENAKNKITAQGSEIII